MSQTIKKLELLAPAGSPEALDAAIGEGADAVYLGLKDFNARLRSANFTYSQFEAALRTLHKMGKKVYVAVNTVFEQREADRMYQFLKYLDSQKPDALIVQDFGVIAMARAHFPSLRLHASTQMNIASARGANALSRHGVSRVVLARELSFNELCSIKEETNLELEVFVHGALCISVSGLCLFSSFLGGKSANRGMCTQACRRLYTNRAESGYYFSPNDLQLLEHIPDLATAGITAFKIEGRMKSASYVGAVTAAYRLVLDAVATGDKDEVQAGIERGLEILRNDFARKKTRYFFSSPGGAEPQVCTQEEKTIDWLNPLQDGGTGIPLGTIIKVKGNAEERRALISPPHLEDAPYGASIAAGDSVRIHFKNDSGRVSHKLTAAEKIYPSDKDGNGYWISVPDCSVGDSVYLIQTKEKNKHYPKIITGAHASKGPGREKAPDQSPWFTGQGSENKSFPAGLYVAVSKPEDLFIVQSSKPQRVILPLTQKNAKYLLDGNKPPLPFKKTEIIFSLNPWFPQEIAKYENGKSAEMIEYLYEEGYTQYIANNLGHFSLFKGFNDVKLIAGSFLYSFNSWSLSFISSYGADGFITPLENNRQNLERTLSKEKRKENNKEKRERNKNPKKDNFPHSKCFVTVFAYPPLFNIKAGLSSLKLKIFADNMGESFLLETVPHLPDAQFHCGPEDGSFVYPQRYFSIIDKIPFLKKAGINRFIIDLSGANLKKHMYRDLMQAVKDGTPLPNSSRFNWKDGFYKPACADRPDGN